MQRNFKDSFHPQMVGKNLRRGAGEQPSGLLSKRAANSELIEEQTIFKHFFRCFRSFLYVEMRFY